MPKAEKAPRPSTGEAIELQPLLGKAVAVQVRNIRQVETKFGPRPLAEVRIWVEGSNEALEGVLFQSYFSKLPPGGLYYGIVSHEQIGTFNQWFLDSTKLTKKQIAGFEKLAADLENEDVPF